MSEHLGDLVFDALRIGEPAVSAVDRAHLETCPTCQARRRALDEDAARFAERFNVAGLAAEALASAEKSPPRRVWWPALAAVAAAVTLALAIGTHPAPELRSKGAAPLVELFVLQGTQRTPVTGPLSATAHLAVRVSPERPSHVRILWGPDPWIALYPGQDAPAWNIREPTWLEHELVLDGAPQPEALAIVACRDPIAHEEAAHLLEQGPNESCAAQIVKITKR